MKLRKYLIINTLVLITSCIPPIKLNPQNEIKQINATYFSNYYHLKDKNVTFSHYENLNKFRTCLKIDDEKICSYNSFGNINTYDDFKDLIFCKYDNQGNENPILNKPCGKKLLKEKQKTFNKYKKKYKKYHEIWQKKKLNF